MQSEHAHFDMNHSQGQTSKVSSNVYVKSLATAALKHIPGSAELIHEHFNVQEKKDPHKLVPLKAKNLSYHLGW